MVVFQSLDVRMSFTPSHLKYQSACSDEVCKRGLSQKPYILHVEQNV